MPPYSDKQLGTNTAAISLESVYTTKSNSQPLSVGILTATPHV